MSPGDLDWDSGQIGLAETLVVRDPVGVRYDSVRIVDMGQQIQRTGSAVPAVRLVEELEEHVFDGAKKLLAQGAIHVREGLEGECRRVVCVSDGRCFGAVCAGRDDRSCAGIERGDDSCGLEGGIYGGGEGEAQVAEGDASEVGGDGHHVRVQELVHHVQRGVLRPPVDRRDVGVFEALNELFDGRGRHCGGEQNNQQLTIVK